MGKRAKDAHRLTRLDEKRFVVLEIPQSANDLVECFPAARGAARSAVDDQLPRIFRDFFIEVVHQHPHRGFLVPALAGNRCAARSAYGFVLRHLAQAS